MPLIDLSDDPEAQIEGETLELLTDKQRAIEHVIIKTFFNHSISVNITDKIRATFRSKLWRMGQCLAKLGGSKRHQQVNAWKDTVWSLIISVPGIGQLMHQKRRLQEELRDEVSKRQKLEVEKSSLMKQLQSLDKVSKDQARTIVSLKTGKERSYKSSRDWSSYSRSHQSVKRKNMITEVKAALSTCDSHFIPISVDVENVESGKVEKIDLQKGAMVPCKKEGNGEDQAHSALYVKDQFTLSDFAYRELSQLTPTLPRLHKLKELTKELNSGFDIVPSPDGFIGVQQSFKARLMYRLQYLTLSHGEAVQVKLTGDGTNIAKHVHVVNFAFTLLNEGSAALSPYGNHSLAILQVPESYDYLSGSLEDIVVEASELKSVEINGNEHHVEYFLGGDLKFLAIVCGIQAANSKYSCVWCECPDTERWDMDKSWSAFDKCKGARTLETIERCLKLPKTKRLGCKSSPIFKFIPIDHVMIDSLHLFLRISDVLINLLIQELRKQDGITQTTLNVTAYESFLNDVCKINFHWYTCQETKQTKWRDLSGPEKIILFNKIDIPKFFPSVSNASAIQDIWMEFWRLFRELAEKHTDPELQSDI